MPGPQGIYLDGGFGVGKTHLLVAAYLAAPGPKAFLTFEELTYTLGLLGLREGVRRFSALRYLFLDEFELDDPGNAQMVTHFLALAMDRGLRVATPSNTPPGALGEGRFNAEQFRHQIQGLARRFAVERIEGEDFRHHDPGGLPEPWSDGKLLEAFHQDPRPKTLDAFPDLLAHLRTLTPSARAWSPYRTRTMPCASYTLWIRSITAAWPSGPRGFPWRPSFPRATATGPSPRSTGGRFPAWGSFWGSMGAWIWQKGFPSWPRPSPRRAAVEVLEALEEVVDEYREGELSLEEAMEEIQGLLEEFQAIWAISEMSPEEIAALAKEAEEEEEEGGLRS